MSSAEDLDEDRLRVDPLETGVDPPEQWTAADRYGTTPGEAADSRPLTERINEEQPDVQPTSAAGSTETSVRDVGDVERGLDLGPEPDEQVFREAVGRGQAADEAGGSVAAEIRNPEQEDQAADQEEGLAEVDFRHPQV